MKQLIFILSILIMASCGSEKSVERETNKSKKIVIQKFIDEYAKKYEELMDNAEASPEGQKAFDEFVTDEKNIRMATEALKHKEVLSEDQIQVLESILNSAKERE